MIEPYAGVSDRPGLLGFLGYTVLAIWLIRRVVRHSGPPKSFAVFIANVLVTIVGATMTYGSRVF